MIPKLVKTEASPTERAHLDPVLILQHLETILAAGVTLGRVSRGSMVGEDEIRALLNDEDRPNLGQIPSWPSPRLLDQRREEESQQLRQIEQWLNSYEKERQHALRQSIATPTRAMLEGIIASARRKKALVLIVGSYGIGKSVTFSEFARRVPLTRSATGAAYVLFGSDDNTVSAVYQRIAEAMRVADRFASRKKSISRAVVDNLRSGDVILCDEANYLFDNGNISVLRDIYDASPASLVLAANPLYIDFLKRSSKGIGAFLSRTETVHINSNVEADVDAVLDAERLPDTIRTDAIRIGTNSGESGGLRALYRAIRRAEERAAQVGRNIDAKLFQKSARELGLL